MNDIKYKSSAPVEGCFFLPGSYPGWSLTDGRYYQTSDVTIEGANIVDDTGAKLYIPSCACASGITLSTGEWYDAGMFVIQVEQPIANIPMLDIDEGPDPEASPDLEWLP